MSSNFDPKQWCNDIIHGVGGFHDLEYYEMAAFLDRDVAIVDFTIHALVNKRCDGSEELLSLIQARRQEAQGE